MTACRVDILICTFRRPDVVRTLESLAAMQGPAGITLRVVIADNDDTPSARAVVQNAAADLPWPVRYVHAPARNISIARNACLDAADAQFVAFLDDDEWVAVDWLSQLLAMARRTRADAVFGPVIAAYDGSAPDWIRAGDYHSSYPVRRNGRVETGISGNVLLRWGEDMPWHAERFDLTRGRSGGEDTEFFFRLRRAGARFEICDAARAWENVPQARLSLRWLARRRYRMGQSYAASATTTGQRIKLGFSAFGKAGFCTAMAVMRAPARAGRNRWILRGLLHVGVCAGCLSLREGVHYGTST
ncbi:glycosyltransferase family 2 protein [uncultured Sulfitobacter sp.]|uniref:glycosyltransferase n=1 Tax=uncultured Sulfitobacter sp. TaxID=191468 RepID=UPI002620FA4D|nr:glycosyltransferase family 2 protein [uncultured Sulfitobacter sp.]